MQYKTRVYQSLLGRRVLLDDRGGLTPGWKIVHPPDVGEGDTTVLLNRVTSNYSDSEVDGDIISNRIYLVVI